MTTHDLGSPIAAVFHAGDLPAVWGPKAPAAWLYWPCTGVVAAAVLALAFVTRWPLVTDRAHPDLRGWAGRRDVSSSVSARALLRRSSTLRPSMTRPAVSELGVQLGSSFGTGVFATVEDSMVVLGPPRSGKGIHLAIPMILDAPGPVLTTSTRPDNLAVTMRRRGGRGPVAVFDPQGLATGVRSSTRWSPVRGCEDPHVAMVRAKALTTGAASGTTDASFWQASAEQAVRCLLHAAALGECSSADLYRWSLSAAQAREAVVILGSHPRASDSSHMHYVC